MAGKTNDSTSALVTVVKALEALSDTDKQWVLNSAASRWTLTVQTQSAVGGGGEGKPPVGGPQTSIKQTEAKTFMRAKNPQSDTQRVACLAYYLNHARDTAAFKTTDITKLNTEARGPDFNTPRAISNAARASCGYLSPIGKGQKQLTAFGEEVVEALPSQEAAREVEANRKASKRGKKKRGKKKSKTG